MYKLFDACMKAVEKVFLAIVFAASIFIPVALCVAVVFRYFLKSPLLGVDELCSFAFTAMVLAGSAILFRQKRYIVVDAFIKGMKGRVRQVLDILCSTLIGVTVVGLLYCFWIAIPVQALFTTAVYQVPKSVYSISLIVVFAYMLLSVIETLFLQVKDLVSGHISNT